MDDSLLLNHNTYFSSDDDEDGVVARGVRVSTVSKSVLLEPSLAANTNSPAAKVSKKAKFKGAPSNQSMIKTQD